MTKAERAKVEDAIRELMADNFDKGVGILCGLVGWRYPASEVRPALIDFADDAPHPPE